METQAYWGGLKEWDVIMMEIEVSEGVRLWRILRIHSKPWPSTKKAVYCPSTLLHCTTFQELPLRGVTIIEVTGFPVRSLLFPNITSMYFSLILFQHVGGLLTTTCHPSYLSHTFTLSLFHIFEGCPNHFNKLYFTNVTTPHSSSFTLTLIHYLLCTALFKGVLPSIRFCHALISK